MHSPNKGKETKLGATTFLQGLCKDGEMYTTDPTRFWPNKEQEVIAVMAGFKNGLFHVLAIPVSDGLPSGSPTIFAHDGDSWREVEPLACPWAGQFWPAALHALGRGYQEIVGALDLPPVSLEEFLAGKTPPYYFRTLIQRHVLTVGGQSLLAIMAGRDKTGIYLIALPKEKNDDNLVF